MIPTPPFRLAALSLAFGLSSPPALGQTQFAEFGKWNAFAGTMGDIDGDGDLDIVTGRKLYLNDGRGKFLDATASHLPKNSSGWARAIGDVDGDGDLDLVLSSWGQKKQFLYINDGMGKFADDTAARLPRVTSVTTSAALGDVDGDGDLDLVCGNLGPLTLGGEQNRLYLNNGKGSFTDVTAKHLPTKSDTTGAVALGDLDGDGDLDLVVANARTLVHQSGQRNRFLLNDGKGVFATASITRLLSPVLNTSSVALGDVDGDGDLDVVFGNAGEDDAWGYWGLHNSLWLNDGKGKFTPGSLQGYQYADATWAVALGDVDGDGDLDLVVANGSTDKTTGQNRLQLNDGKGKFTYATSRLPKDQGETFNVALGDVDRDGDLDIAFDGRLLLNLERQTHAPLPAVLGKSYQLDYYAKPGYARSTQFAFPFMNLAPAAPPIKLPGLGTFGLSLVGLMQLPRVDIPAPAGKASRRLPIPSVPALVGQRLYVQALTIHSVAPIEAHLTNVVADRITK